MKLLNKLGLATREQRSWAMYDWANSAFPTIMMTAVLPIYYADVYAVDLAPNERTAYWGYTSALAMAIIAAIGPLAGALGDLKNYKKPGIMTGTILGMVFSAMLATLGKGDWLMASAFFILGNIGFALAEVFYDSLLPHITKPKDVARVSTAGYAIGYLGGGLCLCICLAFIQAPEVFGFQNAAEGVNASFLCVALWWGTFSIPLFRHIKEPSTETMAAFHFLDPIKKNIATIKKLKSHRNVFLFLLAFWAYSDGIGTVIKMATIYGKEVGLGTSDMIGAIVMVQFAGVPFTFAFGALADKIGSRPSLIIALTVYSVICIIGYFMSEGWHFWLLAFLVSIVQGAAQALSRSIYISLIPKEESGEFCGFYSVSSRFAGIFGPLIFAFLSQFFGSSRLSILAIIVLFVVGIALLTKVKIPDTRQAPSE